jgi:hypothetical protein
VRLDRHADGMPPPMPHELVEAEERLAEELIARERLAAPVRAGGEPVDVGGPRIVPAFPRRR